MIDENTVTAARSGPTIVPSLFCTNQDLQDVIFENALKFSLQSKRVFFLEHQLKQVRQELSRQYGLNRELQEENASFRGYDRPPQIVVPPTDLKPKPKAKPKPKRRVRK
jgi:hypothetical protein